MAELLSPLTAFLVGCIAGFALAFYLLFSYARWMGDRTP